MVASTTRRDRGSVLHGSRHRPTIQRVEEHTSRDLADCRFQTHDPQAAADPNTAAGVGAHEATDIPVVTATPIRH
jgi:hypothetical protein